MLIFLTYKKILQEKQMKMLNFLKEFWFSNNVFQMELNDLKYFEDKTQKIVINHNWTWFILSENWFKVMLVRWLFKISSIRNLCWVSNEISRIMILYWSKVYILIKKVHEFVHEMW
jgi:hypothetical protein